MENGKIRETWLIGAVYRGFFYGFTSASVTSALNMIRK